MREPRTIPSIWQWSDRWAPEVLHLADGANPAGNDYTSTYWHSREILGINCRVTTDANPASRYLQISLSHAGNVYAVAHAHSSQIASKNYRYHFQRTGIMFLTTFINNNLFENLPENFLWLPDTTLRVYLENGLNADLIHEIVITSRRWRVA